MQFVNTFISIVKKIRVVFLVLTLCLSVGLEFRAIELIFFD